MHCDANNEICSKLSSYGNSAGCTDQCNAITLIKAGSGLLAGQELMFGLLVFTLLLKVQAFNIGHLVIDGRRANTHISGVHTVCIINAENWRCNGRHV